MIGRDLVKVISIFENVAISCASLNFTKAHKNVIVRDSDDFAYLFIKGFDRIEQYEKRMRKLDWEAVNKYCEWDEKGTFWRIKMNEDDDHEIPDKVLKPKKLSPIH